MIKTVKVLVARIYVTESSGLLKPLVKYLHEEIRVRGISVFRAVSGFGESGMHGMGLVDFSLDLPLAIEFFDLPEKALQAVEHVSMMVRPEHVIFWEAESNA